MRGRYDLRTHLVLSTPIHPPFPDHLETVVVGMGCFWGAEKTFWELPGVYSTHVGYIPNGSEEKTEVVRIVFDPSALPLHQLFLVFWQRHAAFAPSRRSKYRSCVVYTSKSQRDTALAAKQEYERKCSHSLYTDIVPFQSFEYADDHHQQYHARSS